MARVGRIFHGTGRSDFPSMLPCSSHIESCMLHVSLPVCCSLHVACTLHRTDVSCCMYDADMVHAACCMHVACMIYVTCCLHVACCIALQHALHVRAMLVALMMH